MRYKRNNLQKFTILIICSLILMFVFSILSMLIGQKKILPLEVLKALFKYDGSFNHQIILDYQEYLLEYLLEHHCLLQVQSCREIQKIHWQIQD